MTPLRDSKILPDFFFNSCQTHNNGSLLARKVKNRKYCTTCSMPVKEREQMGILSPYANTTRHQASLNQSTKIYSRPLTDQSLYAITGENNGPKKSTETI